MYLERDNDTDRLQSLFIYTHLYLHALIQVPSVTIQWNPGSFCWNLVESGEMDAFLQESVGHQKVQGTWLIREGTYTFHGVGNPFSTLTNHVVNVD